MFYKDSLRVRFVKVSHNFVEIVGEKQCISLLKSMFIFVWKLEDTEWISVFSNNYSICVGSVVIFNLHQCNILGWSKAIFTLCFWKINCCRVRRVCLTRLVEARYILILSNRCHSKYFLGIHCVLPQLILCGTKFWRQYVFNLWPILQHRITVVIICQ